VSLAGEVARLETQLAQFEIDLAKTQGELALAQASFDWNDRQCRYLEPFVKEKGAFPEIDYLKAQTLRAEAEKNATSHAKTVQVIQAKIDHLKQERAKLPKLADVNMDAFVEPLKREAAMHQQLAAQIQSQIRQLKVRAPFDGMITRMYLHPNQAVRPGLPIMTIVSQKSPYVLAYIRQNQMMRPEVGMVADVQFRAVNRTVRGHVVKIGPAITDVSPKQWTDPRVTEWGLPIAIRLDISSSVESEIHPRPGEIVNIRLRPDEIDPNVRTVEAITFDRGAMAVAH
jgi:multidrug resistance efflux pump